MSKKHGVTTNAEYIFYMLIKNNIHTIFDVGSRNESEFLDFEGEVHYFDPVPSYINELKSMPTKNSRSFFNNFGLSFENDIKYYYPCFESFYDRVRSCNRSDDANKRQLEVRKAKDYIEENNIQSIDFLKIDTEGYEFNVLKGFESHIQKVKIIQFEYGGTFIDNDTKLADVVDYLRSNGFDKFSYLDESKGIVPIVDFTDHYQYSNIVCINTRSEYVPY